MSPYSSPPRARSDRLLIESVGDELVVYDCERDEAHCLSPLAAAVFAYSDGRTSPDELAARAGDRLGRIVTPDDVSAALAQLDERVLLASAVEAKTLSRGSFVKKAAFAGAVAVPLVASIAAPAGAASCLARNADCTNARTACCPGLTCQQNGTSGTFSCK
jgi:hypothetical protein